MRLGGRRLQIRAYHFQRRSLEYTGEEGKKLASFQLPILLSASLVSLDFAINMANRELEKQGVPIIPEFPKLT